MNIELKPIAESKVRQLGGDVCGVLVRNEAGAWAAVSEGGRVMWLDDFEGQPSSAQGGRGADAVKWSDPAVDPIVSKLYRKFKEWNRQGFGADDVTWCEVRGYVAELLNTQPQPAVPEGKERLTEIYRREATRLFHELNNLRSEYHNRTAELETEIEDLQEELQRIRRQPAVPEGWTIRLQEDGRIYFSAPSGARGSIKRRLPKDDEPISDSTLDRAFFDLCSDLLSTPTTPQADGWVKCSERLPDLTGWYLVALTDPDDIGWSTCLSWAAFWNGEDFEECDPVDDGQPVTHWMPFPQPPKEGSGDE